MGPLCRTRRSVLADSARRGRAPWLHAAVVCAIVALLLLVGADARAWTPPQETLVVATKEAPPFAMRHADGTWHGVTIDLWQGIAADLGLDYEIRELGIEETLDALEAGTIDAAVAAFTITAERETRVDFTHPFFTTGLGIAIVEPGGRALGGWFWSVLSHALPIALVLIAVLLGVGVLLWWLERGRNPEHFGGKAVQGIGAGFWWAAVTMTTVGYGDRVPRTGRGRIVALLWMFASILLISSFTAALTSGLTLRRLESSVRSPDDLYSLRVASVAPSVSAEYLARRRIEYTNYPTALAALRALARGDADAVVYDSPILRYLVATQIGGRVRVLKGTFDRQDYGIGLPTNSPLRERINRVLLKRLAQPEWEDVLTHYLGR